MREESRPKRRHAITACVTAVVLGVVAASVARSGVLPALRVGSTHPMKYYVSLPVGWSAERLWDIMVTIDGAGGAFWPNNLQFVAARGTRPFIIVTPVILSNGGAPNALGKGYSQAVADEVGADGALTFDEAGLLAVIDDVVRDYGGRPTFFLTGFSAGGHLTWLMTLKHPDRLAAVSPASANYAGRRIDQISSSPAREGLPVHGFQGDKDRLFGPLNEQWALVEATAASHGYANVSREIVPGRRHSAFAPEVVAYFASVARIRHG